MSRTGLYFHIPFCKKKCDYCDFCSFAGSDETLHRNYLKALQKELDFGPDLQIATVYIGGGTPTILSNKSLEKLMDIVRAGFVQAGFKPASTPSPIELTIEANPGTIDYYKLKTLKDRGVNRLSIGAQSFDDKELKLLGRIHDTEDIYASYEAAIKAGFSNINLDLIFGLPGQTVDDWNISLKKAVKLRPKHISAYNLQIEEETPFHERYIVRAGRDRLRQDNDTEYHMYADTIDLLKSEGYIHYEISNFCLPGFECRHNLNYWENGEYLGVGVAASSHLNGGRRKNTNDLKRYLVNPVNSGIKERHSKKNEIAETMFMGLRLIKGVSLNCFKKRFGKSLQELYRKEIKELSSEGLVELEGGHLRLTGKGLFLANEVFERFV
ncbi:MAG: radical SAM family heme chaperone HemW [Candidatus Margulisiibacteriota bacterium]